MHVSLDIRLESAAVQVYRSKTWYYVCGDVWHINNTRVVCWDLGYSKKSKKDHYFTSGIKEMKVWRNDIQCNGAEDGLRKCSTTYRPNSKCTRIVHVQCKGKCKFFRLVSA